MRLMIGVFAAALGLTAAAPPLARRDLDPNGDPLPPGAVARLGTVRFRHGGVIRSVGFTPDGKRVVAYSHDGVRVWDAATGREVDRLLPAGGRWATSCALAKAGDAIITTEAEQGQPGLSIRVRSLANFKVLREFAIETHGIEHVSPDGKLIAGSGRGNSNDGYIVELWEVRTGKQLRTWPTRQKRIWQHAFTPDGKHYVTGGEKHVRFWDVATGKLVREITGRADIVSEIALSPDGARLATVGTTEKKTSPRSSSFVPENVIRLWDVATGKETHALKADAGLMPNGEPMGVGSILFTPDGRSLVSFSGDGILRFWDVTTGKEQRRFSLGKVGVWTLAFSPDGKTLAACSGSVRLIDVATGKDKVSFVGSASVHAADVSPDGRAVATIAALGDGAITLWDAATGRERGRIGSEKVEFSTVRFATDGRSLVGLDRDKNLRVWDAKTLAETRRIPVAIGTEYEPLLALSPDRESAVVRSEKGDALILHDLATGKERGRIAEAGGSILGAAFTPDGRSLVYWGDDHFAHVWDWKAHKKALRFEFHKSAKAPQHPRSEWPYRARLSPDGRFLVYGNTFPKYVALHEVATGKLVRVLDDRDIGPNHIAITPDGRTLAWAGDGSPTIRFLELANGRERHKLDGHMGRVFSLSFAADGSTLVSSSQDGTGLVWDIFGNKDAPAPLVAKELDACWADLAGEPGRAFQTLRKLLRSPAEAGPYLARRVRRVAEPDAKRVAAWLADLDSDSFEKRKTATAELEKLGELAAEPCRRALANNASLEARKRLEKLLATFDADERDPSPERIRPLRAVEALERINTPAAREGLKDLATGASAARLTREAKAALGRATPGGGA